MQLWGKKPGCLGSNDAEENKQELLVQIKGPVHPNGYMFPLLALAVFGCADSMF